LPENSKTTHSLEDIIKGLQYAVNSAQEMIRAQQISAMREYFDNDGNALYQTIKTVNNDTMKVPLISLVPHNVLLIDEAQIEFSTKVSSVAASNPELSPGELDTRHTGFDMDVTSVNGGNVMGVKVTFKAAKTPEGVARVIDECNKNL